MLSGARRVERSHSTVALPRPEPVELPQHTPSAAGSAYWYARTRRKATADDSGALVPPHPPRDMASTPRTILDRPATNARRWAGPHAAAVTPADPPRPPPMVVMVGANHDCPYVRTVDRSRPPAGVSSSYVMRPAVRVTYVVARREAEAHPP